MTDTDMNRQIHDSSTDRMLRIKVNEWIRVALSTTRSRRRQEEDEEQMFLFPPSNPPAEGPSPTIDTDLDGWEEVE